MSTNRQFRLASRPTGPIGEEHFDLVESEVPAPGEGEALVKVTHLSMDPTIRTWIQYDTYLPKIEEGEVIRSLGVGEIVASNSERYPVGSLAMGLTGWQEHCLAVEGPAALQVLPPGVDAATAAALFGPSGLAAYFGILEVGKPESGDTVLVSGAAGATGLVAGQIAKELGCRVVGTAGSDEKCELLTSTFGFDAAINYKTEHVGKAVRAACPDGVDVYFDNVGGEVLEAAIDNLALHGRIALCGAISQYDSGEAQGPRNYSALISKRGTMQGFLIFDYVKQYDEAMTRLGGWAMAGTVQLPTDITDGFENTPAAFKRLFTGANVGKTLVAL